MPGQVLTKCSFYLDGFDLSSTLNAMAINSKADVMDSTTFDPDSVNDNFKTKLPGLKSHDWAHEGYTSLGSNEADDVLNKKVGEAVIVCASPAPAFGEVGFFNQGVLNDYNSGASVGEMHQFGISGESNGPFVRGIFLGTGAAAAGTGAAVEIGAVATGQSVFAQLQIISAGGTDPTITASVESDDSESFPSAATRITFTEAGERDAQQMFVAGPISDNFWRVNLSLGGTDPSFKYILILGII